MLRKKIVAGNWKMNTNAQKAATLVDELLQIYNENADISCTLVLVPPFVFVQKIGERLAQTPLLLGVQDCSQHAVGAYTGEVSAAMAASVGAKYVLIGHSERRTNFGENTAILKSKLAQCLAQNLTPIFCVGETHADRNDGLHFEVIEQQLTDVLSALETADLAKIVLAYEPVWAIGTGLTATPMQAQEMHQFIRKTLAHIATDERLASQTSILYGGSCNAKNAKELFCQTDIDGGLIGGASLVAQDFMAIACSF